MQGSVKAISDSIKSLSKQTGRKIRIMHVCGTHEHTISKYNLRSLLPDEVEVIAGPGCPVCVCPAGDIDNMIMLAEAGYRILTFGDMMRVPSSTISLQELKGRGYPADIILGPQDAADFARKHPSENFVFFCVGFETTAGPVAGTIMSQRPTNLFYYLSLRYVPKAVDLLLSSEIKNIDALIIPGHASIMSGLRPYDEISGKYRIPSCVAGFEPEDVLLALEQLLKSVASGDTSLHNVYSRAVKYEGNKKAISVINTVFRRDETLWRGLGTLPGTGFFFNEDFKKLDISYIEKIPEPADTVQDPRCICTSIILGRNKPRECPMFRKTCRPDRPMGPCMVSLEGSCRISYIYGVK